MRRPGLLETMAREDLDAVLEAVSAGYRPGALEMLAVTDPEWRQAIERKERELGALYEALREADTTLARWRRSVAELHRLWSRVHEVPGPLEEAPLEEASLEEVA